MRSPFPLPFVTLDRPEMVAAESVDWLEPNDLVIGLEIEGVARAYPVKQMGFHHAVNDQINGRPYTVNFCLVCGTGVAFYTDYNGQTLHFDVYGVYNGSNGED
ncbi:DUF3179 domain-containing protein [bacterium]|nr:DUF3179 domain-containing protein [bacterium]